MVSECKLHDFSFFFFVFLFVIIFKNVRILLCIGSFPFIGCLVTLLIGDLRVANTPTVEDVHPTSVVFGCLARCTLHITTDK